MKRRGLHITNTVIVGIALFFFAIAFIGGFFFVLATGDLSDYFSKGSGTFIIFSLFIASLIYFLFLLKSFKKCNLDNSLFKWADFLNVLCFFWSILFVIILMVFLSLTAVKTLDFNLFEKVNSYLDVLTWIGGSIYSGSLIIFLVGYFKNKK